MSEVKPYSETESKKGQIEKMFDNIAGSYDLLNHLFTFGIDKGWRRKMIKMLANGQPRNILDVATGTGDVAIMAAKILRPDKVTGIDLSSGMLELGREKILKASLEHVIEMAQGDSENLAYEDNSFDAVTVAFGVRNFENLEQGLSEMYRVTRPGGQVAILEFSTPKGFVFNTFYKIYSKFIMPAVGKITSGDKKAYSYLHESVQQFPHGEAFINILKKIGYKNASTKTLFFGICTIYNSFK